jgi:2-polyprenyl-6-methoxyphenol hydroxylase-like FAD-dependent oxidoreductase
MSSPSPIPIDRRHPQVLVVGAGPTGLLLAGDLAAAGVDTWIVERRNSESNLTRAFAVHARTLELLDARGLADDLVAVGRPVPGLRLFGRVQVDLGRLRSRYPFVLVTPQYEVERLLETRARAVGAHVLEGHEVVALRQDESRVSVLIRNSAGVAPEASADYVVGCDGVHSAVRRALNLPFPGRSAVRSVVLADVRLSGAPPDVLTVDATPEGFAFIAPFGDGWFRVIAWDRADQQADDAPVDFESLRAITRRVLGDDFGMSDPRWLSRFHSDERQVPEYRIGRILLAGDAAHVHSPAGGQGMNTGLQDAANLSWKLAAVATGRAPDCLLDTYQLERYPVGRDVLRTSSALLRLAMLTRPSSRWLRDHLGATLTGFGPTATRIALRISGLSVSYRSSGSGHPLEGTRAADHGVVRPDGTRQRLYETLREGRFVVVLPAEGPQHDLAGWQDRVATAVSADSDDACLLVRPDGYLASVVTDPDPEEQARHLRQELRSWCGSPCWPVAQRSPVSRVLM